MFVLTCKGLVMVVSVFFLNKNVDKLSEIVLELNFSLKFHDTKYFTI